MALDILLPGDPDAIREAAWWLGAEVGERLFESATGVQAAHDNSVWCWDGPAAEQFRTKISTARAEVDELATGATSAGQAVAAYADDLQTAQAGMRRAHQIATEAGLRIQDDKILKPTPAPVAHDESAGLTADAMLNGAALAETITQAHATRMAAYRSAEEEVHLARGVMTSANEKLHAAARKCQDISATKLAGFVNDGILGAAHELHVSALRENAKWLQDQANEHESRIAKTTSRSQREFEFERQEEYSRRSQEEALRANQTDNSIGRKIEIAGGVITVAEIGLDIYNGEPPGKAILSGAGGAATGAACVELGTLIGTMVAPGPGTAIGAVIGAGVGIYLGDKVDGEIEDRYDDLAPETQDKIEKPFQVIGDAFGDLVPDRPPFGFRPPFY